MTAVLIKDYLFLLVRLKVEVFGTPEGQRKF